MASPFAVSVCEEEDAQPLRALELGFGASLDSIHKMGFTQGVRWGTITRVSVIDPLKDNAP